MDTEKVEALLEKIAEVANTANEIGIDLKAFCNDAGHKVMDALMDADDAEVQAILSGRSAGPAPEHFLHQASAKLPAHVLARIVGEVC
jgi:hypothetical protein